MLFLVHILILKIYNMQKSKTSSYPWLSKEPTISAYVIDSLYS